MTLTAAISQYENLRVLMLGNELGLGIEEPRATASADTFDAFVSSAYVAVRETLAEDASFLSSAKVLKRHEATQSVYLLRTARQHDDNHAAASFYSDWVGDDPIDWGDAVERLARQVEDYLRELIRAAHTVRQSRPLIERWKESDSVSVTSIFSAVCRDLRLSFSQGSSRAKVRAVEGRYRREHPAGPKRQVIADLCVQEALSETGALPVDYSDLLDELGLLGSRDASALLTLAYATSRALPSLRGDDFKRKTSEMWWSLIRT